MNRKIQHYNSAQLPSEKYFRFSRFKRHEQELETNFTRKAKPAPKQHTSPRASGPYISVEVKQNNDLRRKVSVPEFGSKRSHNLDPFQGETKLGGTTPLLQVLTETDSPQNASLKLPMILNHRSNQAKGSSLKDHTFLLTKQFEDATGEGWQRESQVSWLKRRAVNPEELPNQIFTQVKQRMLGEESYTDEAHRNNNTTLTLNQEETFSKPDDRSVEDSAEQPFNQSLSKMRKSFSTMLNTSMAKLRVSHQHGDNTQARMRESVYLNSSLQKKHQTVKSLISSYSLNGLKKTHTKSDVESSVIAELEEFVTKREREVEVKQEKPMEEKDQDFKHSILDQWNNQKTQQYHSSQFNLPELKQHQKGIKRQLRIPSKGASIKPLQPALFPDLDEDLFFNSADVKIPQEVSQKKEIMMDKLMSHFHNSVLSNEYIHVFDYCSVPHFERSATQEAVINSYLVNNIELLSNFDLNLVMEVSRKLTSKTLPKGTVIKFKPEEVFSVIFHGEMLRMPADRRTSTAEQTMTLHLHQLLDLKHFIDNNQQMVASTPVKMLCINKKDFSRCVQMHTMRSQESDDQFLRNLPFFSKLEQDQFDNLLKKIRPRIVEKGKVVYDVGDVSEEMFVIRAGGITQEVPVANEGAAAQSELDLNEKTDNFAKKYFKFQKLVAGQWFGHSEMMDGYFDSAPNSRNSTQVRFQHLRKCRMVARRQTLLLCILKSELDEVLTPEYMALLNMYSFDHSDLQRRIKMSAKEETKQFEYFDEK